ncbi:NADPH oxidase 5 [Folsomia candida]|uniref:NADPH oxidase 5 n=1 Tax=Folsomia candida TaxID=158441 RepID=A0A226F0A4_FOLCA|nr:NADPH oxidase 5 [Folsomia candida]OXA62571.1 NADPH oxidase 5 [Folsomia candida]
MSLSTLIPSAQHETLVSKFLQKCGGQKECLLTREMLADFAGVDSKFHTDRLFSLINQHNGKDTITFADFMSFVGKYSDMDENSKTELLFRIYDTNGDGCLTKKEIVDMLRVSMKENNLVLDDTLLDNLGTTLLEEGLGPDEAFRDGSVLKLEDFRRLFAGHKELIQNLSTLIEKWLQPIPQKKRPSAFGVPCSKKCHNLFYWMGNNVTYLCWVSAFYVLNVALFVGRIFKYFGDDGPNAPIFLGLARGFGWCLDFSSSFILFTMMRQALTRIRSTHLNNNFIPIDDHKEFHRIIGKFIVFASLGHAIAHLIHVGVAVEHVTFFNFMFDMSATTALGLIPGFAYISGFVIAIILLTMFFFTFSFVRRNGYFHLFYISHIVGYPLYYIFMIFHSKNFWKWFIFPGIVFIIEQIFRIYNNFCRFRTTVKMGVILPSKVTNLVLERPPGFKFNPGDYMFINLPHLSRFEWHAFTISSAPENLDELSLHIRAVGPWTENLYNFYNYLKLSTNFKVIHPDGRPTTGRVKSALVYLRHSSKISKSVKRTESVLVSRKPSTDSTGAPTVKRRFTVLTANNYRYQARRPESVIIADNEDILQRGEQGQRHKHECIANDEAQSLEKEQGLPDEYTKVQGKPIRAYIDGPYGAPASEIFRSEHAVLIGAGIGVTPFASILQSIMYRHWEAKIGCPSCNCKFSNGFQAQVNRLKKVDFFWLNPEQNAFSWFLNLISKLEIEQEELGGEMERFLDVHMYMTRAVKGTEMKAVALQLALDLFYEKNKRDCLAKLKTRMNAGRPDWEKVFTKIKESNHGAVSIYFCGPKPLGKQLEQLCSKYDFAFRTETF